MGELRLPGLATGIDTATLIDQIMVINSRRLAKYQVEKNTFDAQAKALDELRAKINALKSSANAISDADVLDGFGSSSSDTDILTISATTGAYPGSHSIEIDQLATSETWIQDVSSFDNESDYVGGGDFIYSYSNQERIISAVDGVTTLSDFVNLINKDNDNPGVTASLLYQGDKYHLMLSGKQTGEDYQISINAKSTRALIADSALTLGSDTSQNAGLTTKITELYQFEENPLESGETITISGTAKSGEAIASLDLSITAETTVGHLIEEINTAFKGVAKATLDEGKIVLMDLTSDTSSLSMGLTYNANGSAAILTLPSVNVVLSAGGADATLTALGSSSFVESQTAQNSQIKTDGYTPTPVAEQQTLTPTLAPTSGTYTLTYEGQTTGPISYATAAADIQTELNILLNVDPGDIVVTDSGTEGLKDGNLKFTFLNTAGNVGMIAIDPAGLVTPSGAEAVSNYTLAETIEGNYAPWITRNSNSITDVWDGVTLNLKDVTEVADPVEITISRSTGAVIGKVQTLSRAYNVLLAELKNKTEYNAANKKMGILSSNIAISFMKSQILNPFIGAPDGFVGTEDDFVRASDLGISFDGAGMMEIDTDEFNDAINDNYLDVLKLLGATKSGTSTGVEIQFHDSSDKYTTAGVYEVEVDVSAVPDITAVRIKLEGESVWRTEGISWTGDGVITCNSEFTEDTNDPLYPENSLQLKVDLTEGNYTATIRVKQGIAGILEDLLATAVESEGRFDMSDDILDDKIEAMKKRIENEENRLDKVQTRLIEKYARLERILTMIQQQMGAVGMIS